MKQKTYHWYPDNSKPGRKRSYPKTACGRDGSDVGGLITKFFEININDPKNCRVCVCKYKREKNNVK